MAPEIIFRQNHGCCSDYFSLGVVVYEMMNGRLPYESNTRKEYRDNLSKELVQIKNTDLPEGWSQVSADFVNKCIQRRPMSRLGFNGIDELKDHKWFEDIDWELLYEMKVKPPFVPRSSDHFKPRIKEQLNVPKSLKPHIEYLEINNKFNGYYYDDKWKYESPDEELESINKDFENELHLDIEI
jgi:serine/threonine protein kinase